MMVRWLRWHCPPDTGFEIRALVVWGRARYLSVTEASHNTDFHTWMGKKQFCFFQTAETGNRTPNSFVKGSSANHYARAPALQRFSVIYMPLRDLLVCTEGSASSTCYLVTLWCVQRFSFIYMPFSDLVVCTKGSASYTCHYGNWWCVKSVHLYLHGIARPIITT